jgi:aspartate aminotransferase-like enzyme
MNKKLFILGPMHTREDVLQKMSTPMIGHIGKEASHLQKSISEKLQGLSYTESTILLSISSRT